MVSAQCVGKRIAFDIKFGVRPFLQQLRQSRNIARAYVALVRARVHRQTIRAGFQAGAAVGDQIGKIALAGVANQGDLVEVDRSEEHTSELQSRGHLVCRLLLEKKKKTKREKNQRSNTVINR